MTLTIAHAVIRLLEMLLALPVRAGRFLLISVLFNPRLGLLRYVLCAALAYVLFAVVLVYGVAPVRGYVGQIWMADKLRYDAERWLATAIYDSRGHFVGTFDARLDSERDVNFSGAPIEVGDYVANPDHKSIPVSKVPERYWQCLRYHEDRHIGGLINPFGIDLFGVLKIPYSTIKRSIRRRRISFGVGGSTLPMQFARVIYKTPPDPRESGFDKIGRKLREWWLAPVIYRELTRNGDDTPLKQWAANHLWLAQRTGGSPLHGVEVTSRVVFGKEAKDLSVAEQFVLASAVNKPIILLSGSDRLNKVRLDRWRYITEVRARKCAKELIKVQALQRQVVFELISLAGGPPDPKVKPKLQEALERFVPRYAKRAEANPAIRANLLLPATRYGLREEMKYDYGYSWRQYVRSVTTTFNVIDNLDLRQKLKARLKRIHDRYQARIGVEYTLNPVRSAKDGDAARRLPDVVVAAANAKGEIVRYFELGHIAPYFGSIIARDRQTGRYQPEREVRAIASTGKILAAIGIANQGRDTLDTLYLDKAAPARGLESCRRRGTLRRGRKALVSFACSLSLPIEWRTAKIGQAPFHRLVKNFGFNMPPADLNGEGTPPSTAVVRGLITGSPRRVHQMAGVVLAALTGRGAMPVPLPSLVKRFEYTSRERNRRKGRARDPANDIIPNRIIRPHARALLRTLLQAPLCYEHKKVRHGTLRSLAKWCAHRRKDIRLHFAKTGTQVTEDPDATVDAWITGGLQFSNGAAYSYVVVVGTGSVREPWARRLHAAQVAAPLLDVLLENLRDLARRQPVVVRAKTAGQLKTLAARRASGAQVDAASETALP